MLTPELRKVDKGRKIYMFKCCQNKIKMQARTSSKKKNTVNATIHENDLQNGTQREIKLWA